MADRHSSVREGVYAGFIGATAVAVWFAIIDTVAGKPFHTPNILGQGLLSVLGKVPMMPDTVSTRVIAYTIFHYAAFALVGIIVASIVHQSHRTPAILAGFLIAFVAFELGAIGLTTLFTESRFGGMAWYQIFIANLLAAGLMFWFMWRRHPALGHDLNIALTGTDDWEAPAKSPERPAAADTRR
ncbi:MAG TPA: hypothetical protein VM939_08715 [Gemmatimonadaceae bacterium]|nr:hypothetical protein [Gemmatimonadaceae bacterium]